jgi:hypothetical protein
VNVPPAVLALIVLASATCRTTSPADGNARPATGYGTEQKLTEQEAILRAEAFVASLGYTDLPGDPKAMSPGDKLLRNTILRKACGLYRLDVWSEAPGWTIVFCHNPELEDRRTLPGWDCTVRTTGRPVIMDPWGHDLGIMHMNISIDEPDYHSLWTPWSTSDAGACDGNPGYLTYPRGKP